MPRSGRRVKCCSQHGGGVMKIQFASLAKRFRHGALMFAAVLVVVQKILISASFSQDGPGAVRTPKQIPSDATAIARLMSEQRTSGGPIPPDAYQNAMKQWAAISTASTVTTLTSSK